MSGGLIRSRDIIVDDALDRIYKAYLAHRVDEDLSLVDRFLLERMEFIDARLREGGERSRFKNVLEETYEKFKGAHGVAQSVTRRTIETDITRTKRFFLATRPREDKEYAKGIAIDHGRRMLDILEYEGKHKEWVALYKELNDLEGFHKEDLMLPDYGSVQPPPVMVISDPTELDIPAIPDLEEEIRLLKVPKNSSAIPTIYLKLKIWTMTENKIYYHKGQLRSILAGANTEYDVCGRGWGKSEGPGGKRTSDWANSMARAAIGIVGATYMQLLDRTLPPLFRAWERLGYRRNVHFWVRQKPPKQLNIPLPYYAPDKDDHTIYWWNGACFKLISQDRPGSANGSTLDGLYGDEAKLLNKKKFDDEIDKANRGNVREFGDYAGHHGILFMTDMPTTPEAKWILDKKQDMQLELLKGDRLYKMYELINLIINYQLWINKLYLQRYQSTDQAAIRKINKQIYTAERKINYLRKETVNYVEGSSLENIHNLGLDTVKKWKRDSLDITFRTQVLNERLYTVPNSFYPRFDVATHCVEDDYDYGYVESMGLYLPDGVLKDSRIDRDVKRNQPLDIAMDAGASINCLVVGQENETHYRYLKSFFVKKPKLIQDVVVDFCKYYEHHQCKHINFYYDHTFTGTDATRMLNYADVVKTILYKHGWTVADCYIGQQPKHRTRYDMWGAVLEEISEQVVPVRFNRHNCAQLIVAVQCAGALEGKEGIQKDKRPEKRSDVPQEEATHLTDAMDTLYIGKYRSQLGYAIPTLGAYFGEDGI